MIWFTVILVYGKKGLVSICDAIFGIFFNRSWFGTRFVLRRVYRVVFYVDG